MWFWEKAGIINLSTINRLGFVSETQNCICEARINFSDVIIIIIIMFLKG